MRLRSHAVPRREALEADQPKPRPMLGSLLVQAGDLDEADLDRIVEYQDQTGEQFGEAAVHLGFVTTDTMARVITERDEARLLDPANSPVSPAVVTAFDPFDPLTLKLRALRATLFGSENMKRAEPRIIVVAGVTGNDTPGLAANLAVITAQLGLETLLVDANFLAPMQHNLFALQNKSGTTGILLHADVNNLAAMPTTIGCLDLLPSGPALPNVNDTVERVSLCTELRGTRLRYQAIVIDAGAQAPETVAAIARGSDGVVIVAERRYTPINRINALIARLESNDVDVFGTILAR